MSQGEPQREQLPPSGPYNSLGWLDHCLLQYKTAPLSMESSLLHQVWVPGLKLQRQRCLASLNSVFCHPFKRRQQILIINEVSEDTQKVKMTLFWGSLCRESMGRKALRSFLTDLLKWMVLLNNCREWGGLLLEGMVTAILIPISSKLKHPFTTRASPYTRLWKNSFKTSRVRQWGAGILSVFFPGYFSPRPFRYPFSQSRERVRFTISRNKIISNVYFSYVLLMPNFPCVQKVEHC